MSSGAFQRGLSSSTAIGLFNECKWVFNKVCTMPWCHTMVHFEVKMSNFRAAIQENCGDRGSTLAKQAVSIPR